MRADLASFPRVVMVAVMTFTESMKRTGQPLPSPTVCGHGSVGENRKKSGKIRSRSWLVCVTTSPKFGELRVCVRSGVLVTCGFVGLCCGVW